MEKVDLSKKQADPLTEESALALGRELADYRGDLTIEEVARDIARALLRAQKIAYLLGQIAAMEAALRRVDNGWHDLPNIIADLNHRLRDLRAELVAMEEK